MHGNGDGQIFAIIVMVVAACEVCVGLGRDRRDAPPPPADRRRRAAGAARLSATDRWPGSSCSSRSPGAIVSALGYRVLPGARRRARSAPPRSPPRSSARDRRARHAAGPRRRAAPGRLRRLGLREHGRRRRQDVDPRRPAERVHDARRHRRLDADPPLLGRPTWTSDRGYARFFAYLNFFVFSMLCS